MTPELGLLWRGPTRLGRSHDTGSTETGTYENVLWSPGAGSLHSPWLPHELGEDLSPADWALCGRKVWDRPLLSWQSLGLAEVILGLCDRYIGHQGKHKSWINNPVLIVEIQKMKKKKLFKLWPSLLSISAALAQKNPEKVPIACSWARSECRARSCQYEKGERAGLVSAPRIGGKKELLNWGGFRHSVIPLTRC